MNLFILDSCACSSCVYEKNEKEWYIQFPIILLVSPSSVYSDIWVPFPFISNKEYRSDIIFTIILENLHGYFHWFISMMLVTFCTIFFICWNLFISTRLKIFRYDYMVVNFVVPLSLIYSPSKGWFIKCLFLIHLNKRGCWIKA